MICTCKGQLQPHDWLNGACPDPEEDISTTFNECDCPCCPHGMYEETEDAD